jgi:putative sigma-54 modulation protein
MDMRLTARHCTISDSLRRRVDRRLRALTRFEPTLESADVLFASDHGSPLVELRLHCRGHRCQATSNGDTLQIAFDGALERAERQLRRRRERVTDHKAATAATPPPLA